MVLQFAFSSCSLSKSGIPNNAGPFPGTTKELHQHSNVNLLCLFQILHLWHASGVICVQCYLFVNRLALLDYVCFHKEHFIHSDGHKLP